MRVLLAVGFVMICVTAYASEETDDSSKDSREKTDKPVGRPVIQSAGGYASECKKNETSGCQPCGAEKSCSPPQPAPSVCTTDCKPACVCLENYVKGPKGNCMLQTDCPKK